ncbi:MAG: TIGR00153 family protein [bacterium]|nr:TIGR00153 family protein [bacterium]
MRTTNPIAALFAKSPFGPVQQHMKIVEQCVAEVVPLVEALLAGKQDEVDRIKDRIFELEGQADDVKNQIRSTLPKSLFLPVDRRDLLDLLNAQDSIADSAQDVAGLLTLRRVEMDEEIAKRLPAFVQRTMDATTQCAQIIGELDELVEMGFRGRGVEHVLEMVEELGRIETETDEQAMDLVRALFKLEDRMKPLSLFLWYELIQRVGDIADYAEDVGDRLRLLVAR